METELSPWHIVDARVELSLTPLEIANGGSHARRAAEQQAFSSFFMRYNRQLGGIPVASQGPLRFPDGKIRLIGASPFSHVTAEATVLLFAPEKGTTLTGRVTHIGPDHIGLTVMQSFHSVLPLSEFYDGYKLHTKKREKGGIDRFWKRTGSDSPLSKHKAVSLGTWIKFSVKGVRGTKAGLFDICGTLKVDNAEERGLGFVPSEDNVDEHPGSSVLRDDAHGIQGSGKARPLRRRLADDALFNELDTFNDDFADMLDHADHAPLAGNATVSEDIGKSEDMMQMSSDVTLEKRRKKINKKRSRSDIDLPNNVASSDAQDKVDSTATKTGTSDIKEESVLDVDSARKKKKRPKTDDARLSVRKKKKKKTSTADEKDIDLSTPKASVKSEVGVLTPEKSKKSKKKRKKSMDKQVNS